MNRYITRNNMQVQFIRFRQKIEVYCLSGYVLFNAISLIHVLRSDTFKAERILIGLFEHNSLERLAAASGCMSSLYKNVRRSRDGSAVWVGVCAYQILALFSSLWAAVTLCT